MSDPLPRLTGPGALVLVCLLVSGTVIALAAEDSEESDEGRPALTVAKAVCGPEDNPETGLQGRSRASNRVSLIGVQRRSIWTPNTVGSGPPARTMAC
jgi:hypothetical protein